LWKIFHELLLLVRGKKMKMKKKFERKTKRVGVLEKRW
jgi:hypothetical protein